MARLFVFNKSALKRLTLTDIQLGPGTQKTHLSKTVKKKSIIQTLRVKGFLKNVFE